MDTLDHKNAMTKIDYEELKSIDGGISISGTLINAFTSSMKTVFNIGRSFGNAIRRIKENKLCEVS